MNQTYRKMAMFPDGEDLPLFTDSAPPTMPEPFPYRSDPKDGEVWRRYAVEAADVADFLRRYYKPDRYTGRGEEYAAHLLASHQADLDRCGWDIISHHDSRTGEVVAFFGGPQQPDLPDTPALRKPYNFGEAGILSLGDFLRSKVIVRKSLYIRRYSEHRVHLAYIEYKKPKHIYTLWWAPDADGREHGYSVSKAIWDLYDVPASEMNA